jgi:hypothetical protein
LGPYRADFLALDVKLGDKDPQSGKRVDLVHTNVAGSKIILEDFPPHLFGHLLSAFWEKVSVTLTMDQRNGLLSGVHYLHVTLVDAHSHDQWVPLEFMLEDRTNGICLALFVENLDFPRYRT